VKFTPPGTGSKSVSVSIPSNAAGSPTVVPLAGTGVTGTSGISASPTSLSFGSQAVGTTSTAQTITVHNTGTTTLSAIGWQLTGANQPSFSIVSNSCSAPLGAGATCTIGVTFNPPGAGAKSAIVNITSSAGSPTVSLSGTGT
jgi:trimeric autotransporter adhesin